MVDIGPISYSDGLVAGRRRRTMSVAVEWRIVVELQVGTRLYRRSVVSYVVGNRTMLEAVGRRCRRRSAVCGVVRVLFCLNSC